MKQDQTRIQIGDVVEVVDDEETYSTYRDWVLRNAPGETKYLWKQWWAPKYSEPYVVIAIGNHETFDRTLLYIQGEADSCCYVIGEEGVTLTRREPEEFVYELDDILTLVYK